MTLGGKQKLFAYLLARLLKYAYSEGFEVSMGETYRHPEWAGVMQQRGLSQAGRGSLHCKRLAVDLNLFKSGRYLTKTEDYAKLGTYWKRLHPLCCWGGDFRSLPDGGHFSLTHGGVR